MEQKETLSTEFEVKQVRDNTLEGMASTFNIDRDGDKIQKGAFQKTIQERVPAGRVKMLFSHDTTQVVGTVVKAEERENGLWIKAELSDADDVSSIKTKLKEGHLDRLSIGFKTIDDEVQTRNDQTVRVIKELKLLEVSVVAFPANPGARVLDVKEMKDEIAHMSPEQRSELIEELKSMNIVDEEKEEGEDDEGESKQDEDQGEEDGNEDGEESDEEEGEQDSEDADDEESDLDNEDEETDNEQSDDEQVEDESESDDEDEDDEKDLDREKMDRDVRAIELEAEIGIHN